MKRIMVVDDDHDTRFAIRLLLEREGFKVEEASGGPQALEALRKNPPDLVLVDFLMPEMSGRALVEEIRNDPKLKPLRVIFLTVATLGEVGKEELKRLGVIDYIQKPFDNEDLLRRIKRALG